MTKLNSNQLLDVYSDLDLFGFFGEYSISYDTFEAIAETVSNDELIQVYRLLNRINNPSEVDRDLLIEIFNNNGLDELVHYAEGLEDGTIIIYEDKDDLFELIKQVYCEAEHFINLFIEYNQEAKDAIIQQFIDDTYSIYEASNGVLIEDVC